MNFNRTSNFSPKKCDGGVVWEWRPFCLGLNVLIKGGGGGVSNSRHYHLDALSADTLLNLMKSYSDYGAVTAIVRGLLVVALVVSQLKPQWFPRWPLTVTKGGWPSNWCCLCVPGILISTYTEVPDLHIPSINLPVYVKKNHSNYQNLAILV